MDEPTDDQLKEFLREQDMHIEATHSGTTFAVGNPGLRAFSDLAPEWYTRTNFKTPREAALSAWNYLKLSERQADARKRANLVLEKDGWK